MPKAMRAVPAPPEIPAEPPKPKKPTTVLQATETGQRIDILNTLRTRIAKAIDDPKTPPRDLAALSNRLLDIDKEIEQLHVENNEEATGGSVSEDANFTARDI